MHFKSLVAALLFLQTRSLANGVRMRLRRLKQPKYLIGAVVGLGWLYRWLGRPLMHGWARSRTPTDWSESTLTLIEGGAAVVLLLVVAAQWIFTSSRAALQFSETELAFLLPAPLSRKMLIRYKLLRGQLGTLFSALFLTIFTGRFAVDGRVLFHVLGWWLVLTLLNLHSIGASFTVQRLTERGLASWLRRVLVIGVLACVVVAAVVWIRMLPSLPAFDADPRVMAGEFRNWAELALTTGPGPWLLLPFRWAVHPWFAANTVDFLIALIPVAALLALHYWWVERSDVAFEEASLAQAEKRSEIIAAARARQETGIAVAKKKADAPFALAPTGRPETALLWKNLIATRATRQKLAWAVALTLAAAMFARWGPVGEKAQFVVWTVALMAFGAFALIGGARVSMGLRQDLGMLDVLKVYPLTGRQLVLGEFLGPALVVTIIQGLLAAFAVILMGSQATNVEIPAPTVAAAALGAMLIVLPLNVVSAIIPSAATLLFPAWARPGKEAQQPGFEAVGQRMIFGIAQIAALLLSLAPAAALGAACFAAGRWLIGLGPALIAGGLGAGIVLAGEAALGVMMLGRLYDRYDPSAEQ